MRAAYLEKQATTFPLYCSFPLDYGTKSNLCMSQHINWLFSEGICMVDIGSSWLWKHTIWRISVPIYSFTCPKISSADLMSSCPASHGIPIPSNLFLSIFRKPSSSLFAPNLWWQPTYVLGLYLFSTNNYLLFWLKSRLLKRAIPTSHISAICRVW